MTEPIVILELAGCLEELDERTVPRAILAVQPGFQHLVIVTNDTDAVTRLVCFIHICVGMKELGVDFVAGEKRRFLALHRMAERMGEPLCPCK